MKADSMAAAAAAVAARAGLGLLIEGQPPQKAFMPATPTGKLSIGDALTQLAEAYDYTWEPSRSGLVLFRKRFSDEPARPEVPLAELKAVTGDLLSILGRTNSGAETTPLSLRLLKSIAASLPPEAAPQLDREGILIASLPPALREQGIRAIQSATFGNFSLHLSQLEAQLAELPGSRVELNLKRGPGFGGSPPLELVFPHPRGEHTRFPVPLWRLSFPGPTAAEGALQAFPVRAVSTPLLQAYSVREAAQVMSRELAAEVEIAPELLDRRLVLLVQKEHAARAPTALAELHGWSYTKQSRGDKEALLLRRRRVPVPQKAGDVGAAILAALPADVARSLTTKPKTLGGQPLYRDPLPISGLDWQLAPSVGRKMKDQTELVRDELRQSLAGHDFSAPVPFAALSEQQQRAIVYMLFADVASNGADTLLKASQGLPSYALDPLNSRILRRGEAYGFQGPSGRTVLMRSGTLKPGGAPPPGAPPIPR